MSSTVSITKINGQDFTFIYDMTADGRSSGGGYTSKERKVTGVDIMRTIMQNNLNDPKVAGRVQLDAKWGSHLFHLKMGAIPVDKTVSFQEMYGKYSIVVIKMEEYLSSVSFDPDSEPSIWLNEVLAIELDKDVKEISSETVKSHLVVLQNLVKNGVPAADSFAYRLAVCILKYKASYPRQGWSLDKLSEFFRMSNPGMASERMQISPEGIQRWKEVVNTNEPFKSFRDLLPLYSRIQRPAIKKMLLEAMKDFPGLEIPSSKIRVHWDTQYGQSLMICGTGVKNLDWDPKNAVSMQWTPGNVWTIDLGLSDQPISFKILLKEADGKLRWMEGNNIEISGIREIYLSETELKFQN